MSTFTYAQYNKAWESEEAIEKFFKKVKPKDFYFKANNDDESLFNISTYVIFVAKVFYNKEKCLDDRTPAIEHLIPKDLFEAYSSTFETARDVENVRKELIELGFEENEKL